jgi:hypothetical protein
MMKKLAYIAALASVAAVAPAQLVDFESYAVGTSQVMFRTPSLSGSTSGNIATGSTSVISDLAPANPFAPGSTRAVKIDWSFVDNGTNRWDRLTTFAAPGGYPNPTIALNDLLSFDIYTTVDLKVAAGIRETGTSASIWADGGSSGTIEWVSNGGLSGTTPAGGMTITAGQWTHIDLNLATLAGAGNVQGFTGNGVIDQGATSKGVLESLALTSLGNAGPYTVYLDNFRVGAVPEPASMAALGLGVAALLRRRRKS